MTLEAPFPYFVTTLDKARDGNPKSRSIAALVPCPASYASLAARSCSSVHDGGRPVRLVVLLVDQRLARLVSAKEASALSRNSGMCMARCAAFEVNSRFPGSSFNLLSSWWWIPIRGGIGPFANSQLTRALRTHVLGSATLTKARCSPPRLWRVLIRTEPTGNICSVPCPRAFFMGVIISCVLWKLHFHILVGKGKLQRRYGHVSAMCPTFVEPFLGSAAVLLNRPAGHKGHIETVNDKDGYVSNFWRAVQAAPEEVAEHADWPVNENDLHARHSWLVSRRDDLVSRLEGDPEWYDAKIAGWWVWGMCAWIGSGFCSGDGPWQVVEGQLVHLGDAGRGVNRKLVHLGDAGQGVNRKLVHLGGAGQGVNRQLVHLGNGRGVNRQLVHLGNAGRGVNRKLVHLGGVGGGVGVQKMSMSNGAIYGWFADLSSRLTRVRVCSGDWTRVCGDSPTIKHGLTGVFLDPPYLLVDRADLYNHEDDVSAAVREWAIEHGSDPLMRIALCGYEGEHTMPEGWTVYKWKTAGGYGSQGKSEESRGLKNRHRERIWFSPHCLPPLQERLL